MDTAFESDALLKLLTEALRRGPGSPEWHSAVSSLRNLDSPDVDEYRMLITARERLESGKQYREVRAGPAFTRELFGQLEGVSPQSGRPTLGLMVRLLCLLVLVAVIGVAMMYAVQSAPNDAQQLSNRLFVTPIKSWTFDSMPADLRVAGPLPLETRNNVLRAAGKDTTEPTGGVVYADDPLDLQRGTCVEARIEYRPGKSTASLSLMPDAILSGTLASNDGELALVVDGSGVHISSPAMATPPRALSAGQHLLRIKAANGAAVAEVDGQTIWSGSLPIGPRGFVAVRLIRDGRSGDVAVRSLRVLAP